MISCVRSLVCRDVARHLARVLGRGRRGTRTRARRRRRAARPGARNRSCGRRCAAACRSSADPRETAARAGAPPARSTADRRRGRRGTAPGRRGCGRRGRCRRSAPPRARRMPDPICVRTPATRSPFEQQVDRPPAGTDAGRAGHFERAADRLPVQHAIGLRARRAHGRALAGIENAELDARRGRPRAPSRRRAHRSRAPGDPCRCRRWRDCSSSARASRCSGSAAACARRCAPRPARPRCRRDRRRRR